MMFDQTVNTTTPNPNTVINNGEVNGSDGATSAATPTMMIFDTSTSHKRSISSSAQSIPTFTLLNNGANSSSTSTSPSINIPSPGYNPTNGFNLPFTSHPNLLALNGQVGSNGDSSSSSNSFIFGDNSPNTNNNNLFVNSNNNNNGSTSVNRNGNRDTSIQRRRRAQSKSVSYSNLSAFQPQNQQLQQQQPLQSLSASSSAEHLIGVEDIDGEYILEYCSVLKDRLKLVVAMVERDQSEMQHRDQEIELLNSKINRYNMEFREKEEENEKMAARIKELEKVAKGDTATIGTLRSELEELQGAWVAPSEAAMWSEQLNTITGELETKDQELEDARLKIDMLTDQTRRERELVVVARTDAETAQRQYRTEREEYFKELDSLRAKVTSLKTKRKHNDERSKVKERELEQTLKTMEKMKQQLSTAEIEVIEQRNQKEKLQTKLVDEERRLLALSSSQQSMTQELKQFEGERLAIIGLMNKNETEIEERVSLLMSECSKSNDTISLLNEKIRDLESRLASEKLNKHVGSISLSDTSYTIDERKLIRIVQEKDEEIQRMHKQIQRLQIDASTLTTRYKKMEENMTENNTQLHITKKSLRNYRKELSKMTQELLFLSDENHNESIQTNYSKRKSIDLSELSKMIQTQDKIKEEEESNYNINNNNNNDLNNSPGNGTFNSSPLRNNSFLQHRRERGLSSPQPMLSPFRGDQSLRSSGDDSFNNTSTGSPLSSNKASVEQLEDMLERARSANIGYRLHIQFLSKEIKTLEKDVQQQKEFTNTVVTRLNFDLEESRRLNTRIRKAFLQRFSKEDDSIFLDYYTLTDKYHPMVSPTLQLEMNSLSIPLSNHNRNNNINNNNSSSSSSPYSNSSSSSSTSSTTSSLLTTPTSTSTITPISSSTSTFTPISTPSSIMSPTKSALKNSNNNVTNNINYNNLSINSLSPITPKWSSTSNSKQKQQQQRSTPPTPIDLSKQCNRCSKEFSIFTRSHTCSSCNMRFCSDCCNTKLKLCTFCNTNK